VIIHTRTHWDNEPCGQWPLDGPFTAGPTISGPLIDDFFEAFRVKEGEIQTDKIDSWHSTMNEFIGDIEIAQTLRFWCASDLVNTPEGSPDQWPDTGLCKRWTNGGPCLDGPPSYWPKRKHREWGARAGKIQYDCCPTGFAGGMYSNTEASCMYWTY
jgi:hypothetical protein